MANVIRSIDGQTVSVDVRRRVITGAIAPSTVARLGVIGEDGHVQTYVDIGPLGIAALVGALIEVMRLAEESN